MMLKLQVFICDLKLFTLRDVDHNLDLLNLRGMDSDKPSPLVNADLSTGGSLKQHGENQQLYAYACTCMIVYITYSLYETLASQMWTLARFLPLAIGHLVPETDPHWQNFLRLLEIMDILFSRTVSKEDCGYLESMISDHHTAFSQLYQQPITPKMHSMIHMPRLILE